MKSANNRGILKGSLQVLHIHVLLVAPLGTSHHHTGAAADLPVQPLNHIVGADASPVFAGEIAVSQRLLNTITALTCTPFVRQYGIYWITSGVFYYAKRGTEQEVYARIQETGGGNHAGRKAGISRNGQKVWHSAQARAGLGNESI